MGFGFNLAMIFIVLPITGLLLLTWLISKKKAVGKLLLLMWTGIVGFVILILTINWLTSKKEVDQEDVYGEYIIDQSKFPGRQADWQYNHFRFEIKENDSIYFYETEGEKIIRTYKGKISFKEQYIRPRLVIEMEEPSHHIVSDNPTLYRTTWSFYYVFKSPKFFNVFFKKGEWEPI